MAEGIEKLPLHGEGIVCLSAIDWDFIWQQNQEMMLRLAAAGNPVLYIENTGVRIPTLRDVPRIIARLRNWWKGARGFREQEPNLVVLSPLLLPFPYSRFARWINARLLGRSIAKWMSATRTGSPILWTFLPTPLVNDLIDDLDPALVVYYSTADFAASSPGAKEIADSEARLLRRADIVFATSRTLQDRARLFREKAVFIPIGVDFETFEKQRLAGADEPPDIKSIARPRFGYVGGLHRWLDMELLRRAALKRPDHHFVLIGPEQTDLAVLEGLPNVHLLGSRPFETLPAYIGAFDAGLIPYRASKYTESVYPTKLNEYLAMGIPVISTALPEVSAYNKSHDGIVKIADDAEHFISLLDESLRGPADERAMRIEAARRNGWARRLREMSGLMQETLARKREKPKVVAGILRRLAGRYQLPAAAAAATSAVLCAILFWTPLAWRLSEPLRLSQTPLKADAIIVIAAGAGELGELGQGHEERIVRAIQLYREGYARKIVLCSAARLEFRESDIMRAIALAEGVQDADILMDTHGGGTRAMVMDADLLVRSRSWRRILLVSSPYNMKRAALLWRKQHPELEVIATPVQHSRFYGYSGSRKVPWKRPGPTWRQLRGLLKEAAALVFYRCHGWI